AARRRFHEHQAVSMPQRKSHDEPAWRELQAALDEEVQRLPEKYRAPFVLCCLEGKTKAEAAKDLGWKEGTVSGRLAEARKHLQRRLARRGVSLAAVTCAAALSEAAISAAVPPALAQATIGAALAVATGQATLTGAVSLEVAAVVKGVTKAMFLTKCKIATAVFLALSVVAGAGALTRGALAQKQAAPPQAAEPQPVKKAQLPSNDVKQPRTDRYGDPLPEGAIARLGTLRFRQGGGYVNRLLLTPDGKTLVSKSYYGEGSVAVWDFPSGKLLHRLPGHYDENRAVAVSPDGKMVATGQDAVISFWDAAT